MTLRCIVTIVRKLTHTLSLCAFLFKGLICFDIGMACMTKGKTFKNVIKSNKNDKEWIFREQAETLGDHSFTYECSFIIWSLEAEISSNRSHATT